MLLLSIVISSTATVPYSRFVIIYMCLYASPVLSGELNLNDSLGRHSEVYGLLIDQLSLNFQRFGSIPEELSCFPSRAFI